MRGCPLPAPPIASRQPYNRPFTAAFGGSHGRTPHRQAPLCCRLGRRRRNACHRARICSRRLSLTAGDVGQSVSAGRRRRCCRPSVCGRDGAAAEAAARGRNQSRGCRGGGRAVRCQCKAGRLYPDRPPAVAFRLCSRGRVVRAPTQIHARRFYPDCAPHRWSDGAGRQRQAALSRPEGAGRRRQEAPERHHLLALRDSTARCICRRRCSCRRPASRCGICRPPAAGPR